MFEINEINVGDDVDNSIIVSYCGDSGFDANSDDEDSNSSVYDKIVSEFVGAAVKQVSQVSRVRKRIDAKVLFNFDKKRGASE